LISPYEEAKKKLPFGELTDELLAEAVSANLLSVSVHLTPKTDLKSIG
jgi:hypothetical protein